MLCKNLLRTCAISIGLATTLLATYSTEGYSMIAEEQWQERVSHARHAIVEHETGQSGHNNVESYSTALRTIRAGWINSDLMLSNLSHPTGCQLCEGEIERVLALATVLWPQQSQESQRNQKLSSAFVSIYGTVQ